MALDFKAKKTGGETTCWKCERIIPAGEEFITNFANEVVWCQDCAPKELKHHLIDYEKNATNIKSLIEKLGNYIHHQPKIGREH